MSDEIRSEAEAVPAKIATPRPQHSDKFAMRRAEIKRQKRKAHRHKINASNRPG